MHSLFNYSYYDSYTGQYAWQTEMGEGGGALFIMCPNHNVTLTNVRVENVTGGGEEGGALLVEAYDFSLKTSLSAMHVPAVKKVCIYMQLIMHL